jgi:hypothetical protein
VARLDLMTWTGVITGLLLVIVCAGVVLRAMVIGAEARRGPCCGGCGSGVGSLAAGKCPECGGDYLRVGVTTPAAVLRQRPGPGTALLAWTTLCMAGASVMTMLVQNATWFAPPPAWTPGTPITGKAQLRARQRYAPWDRKIENHGFSEDRFRVDLSLDAISNKGAVESGVLTVTLRLTGTSRDVGLGIDMRTGEWVRTDEAGKKTAGRDLDLPAVQAWFGLLGLDGAGGYAAEVHRLITEAIADPETLRDDYARGGPFPFHDERFLIAQGGAWSESPATIATRRPLLRMGLGDPLAWWMFWGGAWLVGGAGMVWRYRRLVS